jgi:hypothetical protein
MPNSPTDGASSYQSCPRPAQCPNSCRSIAARVGHCAGTRAGRNAKQVSGGRGRHA